MNIIQKIKDIVRKMAVIVTDKKGVKTAYTGNDESLNETSSDTSSYLICSKTNNSKNNNITTSNDFFEREIMNETIFGTDYSFDDDNCSDFQKYKKYSTLDDGELPILIFGEKNDGKYTFDEKYGIASTFSEGKTWDRAVISKETASQLILNNKVTTDFKNRNCVFNLKKDAIIFLPDGDERTAVAIIERDVVHCHFPDDKKLLFPCAVACILPLSLFKRFEPVTDYQEICFYTETFSKLSFSQQEKMLERASAVDFEVKGQEYVHAFMNKDDLQLMYALCKHTLSPTMRKMIETCFEQLQNTYSNDEKTKILTQLSYALNIDITKKNLGVKRNYYEIITILNRNLFGMENLKEVIAEFLLSMMYGGKNHFSVLLVGPPGTGKTSICESIAEALNCNIGFINCGCRDSLAIAGLIKSYAGAQPSKISKAFMDNGTTDILLVMDELDKMTVSNNDGDPFGALAEVFGYQCRFSDAFFDEEYVIPLDNTKIICTANDITKIPDYIQNRFDYIFCCDGYDAEYKVEIAKRHIIPKLLSYFAIKENELIFSEPALFEIAEHFCSDSGAREMQSYIKTCIRKVIKYWSMGKCTKPINIDCDFVKENLIPVKVSNKRIIGF